MEKIVILDFGGQYCHLISRRIRDLGVNSEILPSDTKKESLISPKIKGIILSGGASSVYDSNAPHYDSELLNLEIPILGICYGHQLIAHLDKGEVISSKDGEYGNTEISIIQENKLLNGIKDKENVWMNHKDIVKKLPPNYKVTASTKSTEIAAFEDNNKKIYGVQFHPEVSHTANGTKILENFVSICNIKKDIDKDQIIDDIYTEIKEVIGNKKAIIGLSGGIDSSVAAVLTNNIIGQNLIAIYVDTGLMREGETELMKSLFSEYSLKLKIIDAKERFLEALKNLKEPEQKRKAIGKLFVEIFEDAAEQEKAEILIQGTIYSDRIESGITKHSSAIKSHHNVGGLPKDMKLKLYEPLKNLYKDEVRKIAEKIGLPKQINSRHVFPGPGMAVRIVGQVTKEKAEIVRKASYIIEEEIKEANLYDKIYMAFAVLLPVKSTGIQGDKRSYKYPIVLRIVESNDVMTANFAKIPWNVLEKISTRITNEMPDINRVVYDISNKPPATMEWE